MIGASGLVYWLDHFQTGNSNDHHALAETTDCKSAVINLFRNQQNL